MMSEEKAQALGLKPLGYVKSYAFAGVEPNRMGIGPAHAIPKALKKANEEFPDLILLDVMLPTLDGFSICKEIRKEKPTQGIIIITAKVNVTRASHSSSI